MGTYNYKGRPKQVNLAIFLLIASQAFGLLVSTIAVSNVLHISGMVGHAAKEALIFIFFLLPIYILIFIKIAQGKNWARIAYIPIYTIFLLWHSTWVPVIGLSELVPSYQIWIFIGHLPLVYALYLLFTNPASLWFQRKPFPTENFQSHATSLAPATTTSPIGGRLVHALRATPLAPATTMNTSDDRTPQAWGQVSNEMDSGYIDKGLWARCFAESDGDESKTKARYMQARQQSIVQNWQKEEAAKQIINAKQIEAAHKRKLEEENTERQEKYKAEQVNSQKALLLRMAIDYKIQNETIWQDALEKTGGNHEAASNWYIQYCIDTRPESHYKSIEEMVKKQDQSKHYSFFMLIIAIAAVFTLYKCTQPSTKKEAAVEAEVAVTAPPIEEAITPGITGKSDNAASALEYATLSPEVQDYLSAPTAPQKYPDINSEQTDFIASAPKFAAFPATDYYYGPAAPAQIGKKGKNEYLYRTRLKSTQTEPMNFAGHYTLTVWGCGTGGCIEGAIVDKRNGKVIWLPSYVINWEGEGSRIFFKPESRLLILAGNVGDKEDYGINIYALENDDFFQRIHFIPQIKPEPSY